MATQYPTGIPRSEKVKGDTSTMTPTEGAGWAGSSGSHEETPGGPGKRGSRQKED